MATRNSCFPYISDNSHCYLENNLYGIKLFHLYEGGGDFTISHTNGDKKENFDLDINLIIAVLFARAEERPVSVAKHLSKAYCHDSDCLI